MSTDDNRGKIQNRQRAAQLRSFAGLRFGRITPTDLDALIEYHNKAYVLIEVKLEGAEFDGGQKLALERLCDDLEKAKPTLLIFARHNYPIGHDIDCGACMIEQYRWQHKWYTARYSDVRKLVEKFIAMIDNLLSDRVLEAK
jgi:hypothetical protein